VPARPDRPEAAEARLTVLSGPSGVGKDAVLAAVRRRHPEVWVSTSVTTRPPRPTETDGVEYHFVGRDEMARLIEAGDLLEWAEYAGNLYGTPRRPVLRRLAEARPAFLVIELQGMRQVRKLMPDAQFVFLAPPSFEELERRLVDRGTEPVEVIRERVSRAADELTAVVEYDYALVNEDLVVAVAQVAAILDAEARRVSRQGTLPAFIEKLRRDVTAAVTKI